MNFIEGDSHPRSWKFDGDDDPDLSDLSYTDYISGDPEMDEAGPDETGQLTVPFDRPNQPDDRRDHLPKLRIPTPYGEVKLLVGIGKGDRVATDLGKQMAPVVAAEGIPFSPGRKVLVFPSGLGVTGLTLGVIHPAVHFDLYDPDLHNARLTEENIEKNYIVTVGNEERIVRNVRPVDEQELLFRNSGTYDGVVYEPQSFIGLDAIAGYIRTAHDALADDGHLFIVTHKKRGGERHRSLVEDTFRTPVSEIYVGRGGYRIYTATKQNRITESTAVGNMITVSVLGKSYPAYTEPGLFSKDGVDHGTRFLLETASEHGFLTRFDRLLDVGCGWGAIGLTAAILHPRGEVVMVDTDTRACRIAGENAARLDLGNVEIIPTASIQSDVRGQFDLILSNPPFHANSSEMIGLLKGIRDKLGYRGNFLMVVEETYAHKFLNFCYEVFGNASVLADSWSGNSRYKILTARK